MIEWALNNLLEGVGMFNGFIGMGLFQENDYILYTYQKEIYIAIFNSYCEKVFGNVYITLVDGSRISTHKSNIMRIDYTKNENDYLAVIDCALDTKDKEWFQELRQKLIGGALNENE